MFVPTVLVILGGFLPPFIWLYFILKEDARNPEPKRIIALALFAGMLGVPLVLPLEQYAQLHLALPLDSFQTIIAWATVEETVKYALAALLILWRPEVDEPLDYAVYLMTVAIGFAALENVLFVFHPIMAGQLTEGMLASDLRFLGSSLLHVVASATIGFTLAFSYNKLPNVRMAYAALGVILAITLHTAFNLLIISQDGSRTFEALLLVWVGAVVIFALSEIVKYRTYRNTSAFIR
ncbi:MAG TPA: PrsW family glutamic-type intramembrane protease [Candidatus Paceibacterota bacterium]